MRHHWLLEVIVLVKWNYVTCNQKNKFFYTSNQTQSIQKIVSSCSCDLQLFIMSCNEQLQICVFFYHWSEVLVWWYDIINFIVFIVVILEKPRIFCIDTWFLNIEILTDSCICLQVIVKCFEIMLSWIPTFIIIKVLSIVTERCF